MEKKKQKQKSADQNAKRKPADQNASTSGKKAKPSEPPANHPKPKPKHKAYTPSVEDRVEARWMYGKKEEVEVGAGRSQVGKWYDAVVTAVNVAAATASVVYDADGFAEEGVLFKNMKLLRAPAPAPASA